MRWFAYSPAKGSSTIRPGKVKPLVLPPRPLILANYLPQVPENSNDLHCLQRYYFLLFVAH